MANPDGSMDGWVAEHQERDHPWPRQTTMAWPRRAHVEALTWSAWSADNRTGHLPQETQPYGTTWSQGPASARFGEAGSAYGVNDHLSPGINHKVQSESVTARRPVDDDLDNFGKYFYYNDLERHIRRYSSSKLRKWEKCTQAGVLAKSGVLTEKDSISQNHEMLKCTNN